MPIVRRASVEDLPRMEAAAREFYASSKFLTGFDPDRFVYAWSALLGSGAGAIFMLEDQVGIVGAIGGVQYPDLYSGELIATEFFWFVSPLHRGKGMRLYRGFEAWARERGCSQIRMVHLADSMPEKLERVYRALGFERAEVHYTKELKG